MKTEIKIFLSALSFYSRIPVRVKDFEKYCGSTARYLPMIGWIVGGLCGLIFYSASFLFPVSVSIILSMIAGLLLTGAFHEDGLADVCDGIGGGSTAERKLEIMKDSHTGVFGVTGIVVILLLKFVALSEIPAAYIIPAMIAGHSLSRFAPVFLMNILKYARKKEESKVLSVLSKFSFPALLFACVCAILPLLLFQNLYFLLLFFPVVVAAIFPAAFFKKQIGGYTGDCLGATQQVCEIVFYLSVLILCRYFL